MRKTGAVVARTALLLVASAISAWAQQIPEAPLAWERELTGKVVALSVSPDGRCVAAATTGALALLSSEGEVLWQRPYFNQWMAAGAEQGYEMAVAPECRWIVVAGSRSYRYVWLLGADGHPRAHFGTLGTPEAIALSHRGDELVVGTAAGHLLFVNPKGQVLRDVRFEAGVFDAVEFSPNDAFVLTSVAGYTVGLFTRGGDTVWTRGGAYVHVWASDDWERFLMRSEPWHGIPVDDVEIIARDGRTIWRRENVLDPILQMTHDGSRFAISSASTYDESTPSEYASLKMMPTLLDRDGKVLAMGKSEKIPYPDSVARCESSRYGEPILCRDQNGTALWQISDSIWNEAPRYTPDLTFIVVALQKGSVPASSVSVVRAYRARVEDISVQRHAVKSVRHVESEARPK